MYRKYNMTFMHVSPGLLSLDFGKRLINGNGKRKYFLGWMYNTERPFSFFSYNLNTYCLLCGHHPLQLGVWYILVFRVIIIFFSFNSSVRLFPFRISRQKITSQQQWCVRTVPCRTGSIPNVSRESGHRG